MCLHSKLFTGADAFDFIMLFIVVVCPPVFTVVSTKPSMVVPAQVALPVVVASLQTTVQVMV